MKAGWVESGMNFSDEIVDHFLHPRNMGVIAESAVEKNSEQLLIADAGQITRGDALRLYLRVRKSDETILEARFQNFGTGMPIASASYVCEKLPGQTLSAALRITGEDLDRALDGLPELKNRQPILILNAIDIAVRTFRGQPLLEKGQKGEPPICFCFQVPMKSAPSRARAPAATPAIPTSNTFSTAAAAANIPSTSRWPITKARTAHTPVPCRRRRNWLRILRHHSRNDPRAPRPMASFIRTNRRSRKSSGIAVRRNSSRASPGQR
jgi:NifU-like protein involved in Fe-S cluster formation